MTTRSITQPHTLYRFYDHTNELLYIGITMNPTARMKDHERGKPWWTEIRNITMEQHTSRESVLIAERAAITTEKPLHNIVHNKSRGFVVVASDMPDDCHNICGPRGLFSVYFPHAWADGIAQYRCTDGHVWTCHWGHHETGNAPENAGVADFQMDMPHIRKKYLESVR